jgi:cation diffusion facilitator family transporter
VNRRLQSRTAPGIRVVLQTIVVSVSLAIVKIVAGILGHSYALIADGIESMLDVISSLTVWGGLHIASIPPDEDHPFGHGKAESMAALAVALFLLAAAAGIAVQSLREILTPHTAPAPFTLLVLALVVLIKELLFRRLLRAGETIGSTALKGDAWHHRSDALTSAAAFIGISVALIGGRGYESADDWAALFACGVIGFNGIRVLRAAVAEMMDTAAPPEVERQIRELARTVPGVVDIEKCLIRKSGPGWLVGIHVEVDGRKTVAEGHAIGHEVKDALVASDVGILDALVHVEPSQVESQRAIRSPTK